MILCVHTENIKYTVASEPKFNQPSETKTTVYSCKFEQTSFGSVLIKRPMVDSTLELYPSSIKHIIHQ
jgi:hypothetical protein